VEVLPITRYFIDCEFLEDGRTILPISIGIVADDGREYYAEVELTAEEWQRVYAHEWLVENVVPHLTGEMAPREIIAKEILGFVGSGEPEFWGYCAAYDWVLVNQLYGPMVEHPRNWPYYCNDVAQLCREAGVNRRNLKELVPQEGNEHNALADARWTKDAHAYLEFGVSKTPDSRFPLSCPRCGAPWLVRSKTMGARFGQPHSATCTNHHLWSEGYAGSSSGRGRSPSRRDN
jgi:hypothetical protein